MTRQADDIKVASLPLSTCLEGRLIFKRIIFHFLDGWGEAVIHLVAHLRYAWRRLVKVVSILTCLGTLSPYAPDIFQFYDKVSYWFYGRLVNVTIKPYSLNLELICGKSGEVKRKLLFFYKKDWLHPVLGMESPEYYTANIIG